MPSSALAGARKNTSDTYVATQDIGHVAKFTLLGVEAHADADGVEGWYSWGGYMQTFSEQYALDRNQSVLDCTELGWWTFTGYANNVNAGSIEFATAKIGYRGNVQTSYLNNPREFNDQSITLKWNIYSNAKGIDGYMKILGTIIKSQPEATGELVTEQTVYQEGATPNIAWLIDRGDHGGTVEEEPPSGTGSSVGGRNGSSRGRSGYNRGRRDGGRRGGGGNRSGGGDGTNPGGGGNSNGYNNPGQGGGNR